MTEPPANVERLRRSWRVLRVSGLLPPGVTKDIQGERWRTLPRPVDRPTVGPAAEPGPPLPIASTQPRELPPGAASCAQMPPVWRRTWFPSPTAQVVAPFDQIPNRPNATSGEGRSTVQ